MHSTKNKVRHHGESLSLLIKSTNSVARMNHSSLIAGFFFLFGFTVLSNKSMLVSDPIYYSSCKQLKCQRGILQRQ